MCGLLDATVQQAGLPPPHACLRPGQHGQCALHIQASTPLNGPPLIPPPASHCLLHHLQRARAGTSCWPPTCKSSRPRTTWSSTSSPSPSRPAPTSSSRCIPGGRADTLLAVCSPCALPACTQSLRAPALPPHLATPCVPAAPPPRPPPPIPLPPAPCLQQMLQWARTAVRRRHQRLVKVAQEAESMAQKGLADARRAASEAEEAGSGVVLVGVPLLR